MLIPKRELVEYLSHQS
jgi:hypothetical protein